MPRICVTRAIKNARYLQTRAPHIIPAEEPQEGYASRVPFDLLSRLGRLQEHEAGGLAQLQEFIRGTKVPEAGIRPAGPLFSGTLIFVRITFNTPSGAFSVSAADTATAVQYATLAAVPISAYASQYGVNALTVSPNVIDFNVNLSGTQYNDQALQGYVNTVVQQNGLPGNSCVIVLSPQGVTNTDGDINVGILGYHGRANVPYCFCNVFGQNLTVGDAANVYALQLSHEIAEMTVDPNADLSNPEVCDPCGPNCQQTWLDFFGGAGNTYIQTTQALPPPFPYTFFINGIVQPNAATQCPPAAQTACSYAPPKTSKEHKDIKDKDKDFKDSVKEIKEKDKDKDIKDIKDQIKEIKDKEHFKDIKDFKEKDLKEFKEKDLGDKGPKEFKEKDKDIVEGPPQWFPEEALAASGVIRQLVQRIENLERQLAAGRSFIKPEERPAVGQRVLTGDENKGEKPKDREV